MNRISGDYEPTAREKYQKCTELTITYSQVFIPARPLLRRFAVQSRNAQHLYVCSAYRRLRSFHRRLTHRSVREAGKIHLSKETAASSRHLRRTRLTGPNFHTKCLTI